MNEIIAPDEFVELLRETVGRGQELIFTPSGRSMRPMLDGKNDKVTLSAKPDRLKKYDIAFYLRPDTSQPVLHRMIGFDSDGGYVFSGDGQYVLEYGITDNDILAVMTSFTHSGRQHSVNEYGFMIYSRLIVFKKNLRNHLCRGYHKILHK